MKMAAERHVAIVLAAGKGSRMHSEVPKQFMELQGRPVIWYSLRAFEESFVDEIILVTGEEQISYCKEEIVEKYRFRKVSRIVAGGRERFDSVYRGLCAAAGADYVYIHDGARPFVTREILERARECVLRYGAGVAGMPSKDTVKIADENAFVADTPPRQYVWVVQTPQVFAYTLIKEAYERFYMEENPPVVTDDAMMVEYMLCKPVRLFCGSYENIKITTPEDLRIAEEFLKKK